MLLKLEEVLPENSEIKISIPQDTLCTLLFTYKPIKVNINVSLVLIFDSFVLLFMNWTSLYIQ